MKRQLLSLSLLILSLPLFALHCGNLGISIINETTHDCTLRASRIDYGDFQDQAPLIIPAGTSSPVFYMKQDFTGIGIQLDYRCNYKMALFYSAQDHCTFSAGKIGGINYYLNDLGLEYQIEFGSYWYAKPGQITWRIHELS